MIRRTSWSEIPLIRIVKKLIAERPAETVVLVLVLGKTVVATCYNVFARKMGWRTVPTLMDSIHSP